MREKKSRYGGENHKWCVGVLFSDVVVCAQLVSCACTFMTLLYLLCGVTFSMCSRQTLTWFGHSRLAFRLDVTAGVAELFKQLEVAFKGET